MKIDRKIHMMPREKQKSMQYAYLDDIRCEYRNYKNFRFTDDIIKCYAEFFLPGGECINFRGEMDLNHFEPDVLCTAIFRSPSEYIEAEFYVGDMQYIDCEEKETLMANMIVKEFILKQ